MIFTRRLLIAVIGAALVFAGCSGDSKPAASSASSNTSTAAPAAAAPGDETLTILVSNDDGVGAPGIDALVRALTAEPATKVTVVAPATNQSGTGGDTSSGSLTAAPATTASGYPATAVNGYPADAVLYGLTTVLTSPPDLVMSGVNAGQNIGPSIDISGTVGAALAATQRGVPALAVSAGLGNPIDFPAAVTAAIGWLHDHRADLLAEHATTTSVANLNVPSCPTGTVRGLVPATPDHAASFADALATPDCTSTASPPMSDVAAFHVGFATLSDVSMQPAPVPPNSGSSQSTSQGPPVAGGTPPPQAGESR